MQRAILFGLILALHALGLLWLAQATLYRLPPSAANNSVAVQFIQERKVSMPVRIDNAVPKVGTKTSSVRIQALPLAPNARPESRNLGITQSDTALRLQASNGTVFIPKAALDEFLRHGNEPSFDVQQPGLDAMEALLKRPVALEFKSTRFDADWQGDRPRLERILEEAVERSTVSVKIPIPGRPGAFLRCGVAILALGGGCGFTANDDGYFVKGDDPDTLSPDEEKQCQAWWQQIVSASTQSVWRKTRKLYNQECLKPPEKR